ncbi:MAG: tetratricopeptide repeat protein [Bacteroidia bacterium]|nr:tetratricopeptide repeat protein [Bacteroidia bacterium]
MEGEALHAKSSLPDRRVILALVLILLGTVVIYLPALNGEFTNWDDQIYVTANPLVTNFGADQVGDLFTQQVGGNIHPVTMLSLILNYQISGLNPFSYHLVNLLFHLANTVLVFLFLWRIFPKSPWPGLVAALLFAVHPLHVESVAWISERKDVLYVFFFLWGLLVWLRYLEKPRPALWILALGLFTLSLLSKPAAVVFPLVLLALQLLQQRKIDLNFGLKILPFLVLAILMGLITLQSQSAGGNLEAHNFNLWQKGIFASYGLVMYLVRLGYIHNVSIMYPFPDPQNLPFLFYLMPVGALLLIGISVYFGRKNRFILFAFLFYLINLILVLQLIGVGNALIADRYTYLSSVGPFFLLGYGIHRAIDHWGMRLGFVMFGLVTFAGATLAIQTWHRSQVWENSGVLWTDVIEKYPQVALAYSNRGLYYSKSGDWTRTIADYQQALALRPDYFDPQYNLGVALAAVGRKDEALEAYTRALKIRPNYGQALNNRGNLYLEMGNLRLARLDFDQAIKVRPGLVEAWVNRGLARFQSGDLEGAMADFDEALRRNPNLGHAWLCRSYVFFAQGNFAMAQSDAQKARDLDTQIDPIYWQQIHP